MWLIGPYLARKWHQTAINALLITVATWLIITAAMFTGGNLATVLSLENRTQHFVEVTGMISEADIAELFPDMELNIIPVTLTYLHYPLLFDRNAALPLYGVSKSSLDKLLAATDTQLSADELPKSNEIYVPERFLHARNATVGMKLQEPHLDSEQTFIINGTITGSVAFAVASKDTVTNLFIQEPAVLVHTDAISTEKLEELLSAKLSERKNIQISGPSHFVGLKKERMHEDNVLNLLCMLIVGVLLVVVLLVRMNRRQVEIAMEQAVARLYQNSIYVSLICPLATGAISGILGWLVGCLAALLTYLFAAKPLIEPRGMIIAIPWQWVFATLAYIPLPFASELLTWVSTRRIENAEFLAAVPEILLPKPEAATTSDHPTRTTGLPQ